MRSYAIMFVLAATVRASALDVWVNQVGFEPNAPKILHVQRSSDFAGDGTFTVKRSGDASTAFSGTLTRKGSLWSRFYWEGDFSELHELGNFTISATVSADTGISYGFAIGNQTLLAQTGTLAFRYFLARHCGSDVTDPYDSTHWHGPCHMDDGVRSGAYLHMDAVGGWHDAGDYGKFPHGFAGNGLSDLLWLYDTNRSYYDALDLTGNSIPDIIDECLYQARWLAKMVDTNGHCLQQTRRNKSGGSSFVAPEVDTNNSICNCNSLSSCDACDDRWIDAGNENTPQETVVCCALIRMHRVLAFKGLPTENFAAKALAIWNHRVALAISEGGHNNLGAAAHHIWAGLDLFAVFGQQDCYDRAVQRVDELSSLFISNPAVYDTIINAESGGYELGVLGWFARTYPNAPQTPQARTAIAALMNHNINFLASPQIGLVRRDDNGTLVYFPTNPDNNAFFLGINRLYLLMTWGAIESHKAVNNPAYLSFALDQLNWVLGANYDVVCMVHAAGDKNLPAYHHRYTPPPGWPKGAQPGVVPNGYVTTYSTGLPQIDFSGNYPARYQTNECWLINNAAYAMALSSLTVFSDDAAYISDTIPATMTAGQTYNVSITMKNTSYVTWDAVRYKLGAVDDSDPFASTRQNLPGGTTIAPGATYMFTFSMTAPASLGPYTTDWRMVQEGVNWFGQTLTRQVQVVSAGPPAPVTQLTATPDTHQINLSWTNPSSLNFTGTMIRWSTVSPPASPTDGTLLIDKPAAPGSSDSTTHANLIATTRYYYSAFAHNDIPVYASPVSNSALPLSTFDFDKDGDVDLADFARLQRCLSGEANPFQPGCAPYNFDGDGDVDSADFNIFLPCMAGSDRPPGC